MDDHEKALQQRLTNRYVVNEWIHSVWSEQHPATQVKVNAASSDVTWEMTVEHHERITAVENGFTTGHENLMSGKSAHYVTNFMDRDGEPVVLSYTLDSVGRLWYVAERTGGIAPVEVKTLAEKNN